MTSEFWKPHKNISFCSWNLSGTVLCDAPDGAKISSQHLFSPNYIVILSLIFLLVLFSSHPT